jgi:hypothetical protein
MLPISTYIRCLIMHYYFQPNSLYVAHPTGLVRLVGGSSASNGCVEVYIGGTWGAVCSGWFSLSAATVVCRQLGLPYASPLAGIGRESSLPFLMSLVQCNGTEARLQDCGYFQGGVADNNLCTEDASE